MNTIKIGDKRRELISSRTETGTDKSDCTVIAVQPKYYTVQFDDYAFCESYPYKQLQETGQAGRQKGQASFGKVSKLKAGVED